LFCDADGLVWYLDRRLEISNPKLIRAWLKYDFPGRRQPDGSLMHSSFQWRAEHFNGTDWDEKTQSNAIYKLTDDPTTTTVFESQGGEQKIKKGRFTRFLSSPILRSLLQHAKSPNHRAHHQRPGKTWASDLPSTERGNYDYLIFSNIWYEHPAVREEILSWGKWMVGDIGVTSFRIDAAQHISCAFLREWVGAVQSASREKFGRDAFFVGEVWCGDVRRLVRWLDAVTPEMKKGEEKEGQAQIYAYDVPLLMNFSRISEAVGTRSRDADLRTLLTGFPLPRGSPTDQTKSSYALVSLRPANAVTFVTNHDTQPGQGSYTPMDASLKALFYAFILLRQDGVPCVFWGDLIGTRGPDAEGPACRIPVYIAGVKRLMIGDEGQQEEAVSQPQLTESVLPSLMLARKLFAYGEQRDYFDSAECVGWTRAGTRDRTGCVVVISIEPLGTRTWKRMAAGRKGERWVDVLQQEGEGAVVVIGGDGFGNFPCCGCSVGVFVWEGSDDFEKFRVVFEIETFTE
jgi:alpha-amylase